MNAHESPRIESQDVGEFARVMQTDMGPMLGKAAKEAPSPRRLNVDPDKVKNGLSRLVLALVKLLHELLERQALRRIDAGSLTDEEVERIGLTLMRQAQEIERLREQFGLTPEDINLDLGPLGKLL